MAEGYDDITYSTIYYLWRLVKNARGQMVTFKTTHITKRIGRSTPVMCSIVKYILNRLIERGCIKIWSVRRQSSRCGAIIRYVIYSDSPLWSLLKKADESEVKRLAREMMRHNFDVTKIKI